MITQLPYDHPRCVYLCLVPASDEEEGAVLFDTSGKAAADPFDTSSGSVQLIAVKPTALPVVHPTSERSQESAVLNGEVSTWGPRAEDSQGSQELQLGLGVAPVHVAIFTSAWAGLGRLSQDVHHQKTSLLGGVFRACFTFIRFS